MIFFLSQFTHFSANLFGAKMVSRKFVGVLQVCQDFVFSPVLQILGKAGGFFVHWEKVFCTQCSALQGIYLTFTTNYKRTLIVCKLFDVLKLI